MMVGKVTKERQVNIRLTADEHDGLSRIAFSEGHDNVSAVIRKLVRQALFLSSDGLISPGMVEEVSPSQERPAMPAITTTVPPVAESEGFRG